MEASRFSFYGGMALGVFLLTPVTVSFGRETLEAAAYYRHATGALWVVGTIVIGGYARRRPRTKLGEAMRESPVLFGFCVGASLIMMESLALLAYIHL